jgi:SAM-dependent methyltransferase
MTFVDPVNFRFYEERHFGKGARHLIPNVNTIRCELWYFRKNRRPGRLLDYGFGYGQEALYFADCGYEVDAIDIAPSAKEHFDEYIQTMRPDLKSRIRTCILRPEDESLPFGEGYFDFIHSNQVIYHLPDGDAIRTLMAEWYRILRPDGLLMFSTIGPKNSIVEDGTEVAPNIYEIEYTKPDQETPEKLRGYLMRDEAAIRVLCGRFQVDEIGWFTNHYCGIDGFHWQILARKPSRQ